MPSPFPGMNPYMERETVWHDFHKRWIPLAAEIIGAQVLPEYFVKIDEHVFIHEVDEASFLELYDWDTRELITVVELLSPANKRSGPDQNHYLAKRYQLLAS